MDTLIPSLSQLIEFAVAPVFLLTGIAGFLNVMSSRLGRISDRVRVAERQIHTLSDPHIVDRSKKEIKVLWRRVKVINWAIGLCVASGLMVCTVIMALFSGSLWVVDLKTPIIVLFILAMMFLISALIVFLVEVKLATNTINLVRTIR
ncbi:MULTISPECIES: DUF2721 domain-containing protein [Alteromonas]|uniref:DUF2721 domain-containing protein n=1 Tax=Alteromonas macleodii TaxID=28108 RepID=A0A6T9Y3W7_ALTMA|nr:MULTISPECIES: DUF2721 domain-containing protein [Alteromonas]MDY6974925.1 DUF2721 domain-containing protein [Pseudomonadota bacterium]AXT38756.1 DUF2721 domain-containing protein [Alteromonas sp. BL110]MCZ8530936.1 DUF2721 domain-containing protein [Alteromonas sp. PRIM-21]RKM83094.1 DUF2721 domain-containing protein [Alteromonas sp. BL110]CAB9495792.1 conserved membrane protein of unknown function [Alteromonas macleodii]